MDSVNTLEYVRFFSQNFATWGKEFYKTFMFPSDTCRPLQRFNASTINMLEFTSTQQTRQFDFVSVTLDDASAKRERLENVPSAGADSVCMLDLIQVKCVQPVSPLHSACNKPMLL